MKKEKDNNKRDNREVAIRVEGLSKTFRVPHEKTTTLKGAVIGLFSKKSYTNFNALEDINFEIKKGEFFGIIGRNGSGKSTLLKILAGIYVPNKGKVSIVGKLSPFLELGVGFNAELTGRENLYLGGAILGIARKEIDEKFDKIVNFAELEEFIDMKLKNYSSGMQVRLAFSLAINAHAEILLMDEVLAVGDTNFQSKCLTEFNRYKEMGKTVILVSHDVATVQRYCDRAMLLRNGKIVKIGQAEEVGSEYMNQNISDEGKRMADEQSIKEKKYVKKTQKVAEITGVDFLDKNGEKKSVFEKGEDISIKVYFKQNKKIDKFNFGVTILSQEGVSLIGISTVIDKINVEQIIRDGYFRVDYKKIPLQSNTYYVNAAVFGENHTTVYDYVTHLNEFKVFSESQNDGLLGIDYEWKVDEEKGNL